MFAGYRDGIYAIKELPRHLATKEWETLRQLERIGAPVVEPVGFVDRPWVDASLEHASAVLTRYVDFAFSYRELISGPGFGPRRNQMLDAFAGLLVELHEAGCFWGDCSLSNVLYRWDAGAIEVLMVDAETSELHEQLSDGQRAADLEIMLLNVAGGMADIAAAQGAEIDDADLFLGEDIRTRYEALRSELEEELTIGRDERYRIAERVERLNQLGFEVEDMQLVPDERGHRVRLRTVVGGRNFHANRLRELTQIHASENQARHILSDLHNHVASRDADGEATRTLAAIEWRVQVFERMLARIAAVDTGGLDPVQAFCDFLHHRYRLSSEAGHDVPDDEAYEHWVEAGLPGFEIL